MLCPKEELNIFNPVCLWSNHQGEAFFCEGNNSFRTLKKCLAPAIIFKCHGNSSDFLYPIPIL